MLNRNNANMGWHELTDIIARAFDLANTGKYRQVSELERTLVREGHEKVHEHLTGRQIRKHVMTLMKNASAAKSASSGIATAAANGVPASVQQSQLRSLP